MKVIGLFLVRNEVDVIETNLRHHFATVLDEAIVLDNGSTDGTLELLGDLARELPLQLASEDGHMYHSARVTRMARFAAQQGADWILPIDADEFWVAGDTPFRSVLEETPPEVGALSVQLVNFVQRRDVLVARPGVLSTMTMRPDRTIGTDGQASRLVRTGTVGWLELPYTPKLVLRATPDVFVMHGNHISRVVVDVPTDALACLHAPIRARSVLAGKLDHGRRSIEERSLAEAGWHLKRWWQMARDGTIDREWEALSYDDGAITVNGARHALVRDDRLKDAVAAVAAQLRAPEDEATDPRAALAPAVGATLVALDTVPGWFDAIDARVLVELDHLQGAHDVSGDLFEIGASFGKSAILLGHLVRPPAERLTVCDVFEHKESLDHESFMTDNHWYAGVTEEAFLQQYERFHERPPDVIVGPSGAIEATGERAGRYRIVHVDGGTRDEVVRRDAATARTLLGPGGLVAFGGLNVSHNPGVSLAVWEVVLGGGFVPLCLTETKLYGTWDRTAAAWLRHGLDEWVARTADVGIERHTLAHWPVGRIYAVHRPPFDGSTLVRIPDLEATPPPPSPPPSG